MPVEFRPLQLLRPEERILRLPVERCLYIPTGSSEKMVTLIVDCVRPAEQSEDEVGMMVTSAIALLEGVYGTRPEDFKFQELTPFSECMCRSMSATFLAAMETRADDVGGA